MALLSILSSILNAPDAGGDVVGPASSTDNAIARYDGPSGKLLQNSGITIDDNDVVKIPNAGSAVIFSTFTEDASGNLLIKLATLAPGAPTAALAGLGAGNVNSGTHSYKITFVTAGGETDAGAVSNVVTTTGGNGQVALSAIPLGSVLTTSRKIYRTAAGGSTYKLLATLADNTTTTYADNIADASLSTNAPSTNTAVDVRLTIAGSNGAIALPSVSGTVALIASSITNGDATHAPSGDAIFDALALLIGGNATNNIGYLNIPPNPQSVDYTTVLADSGKCVLHPVTDDNPRTFTIDKNATVAYPLGTCIQFINRINTLTIAIDTDTLIWSEDGSTGPRTLSANGTCVAEKTEATVWLINGSNLS